MAWWLLQSVVIAALLTALVQIACRWGRIGPVGRHALWVVVLVKLLTPPLVVWPWAVPQLGILSPDSPKSPGSPEMVAALSGLSTSDVGSSLTDSSAVDRTDDPDPTSLVPLDRGLSTASLIVLVWVAGAAVFALVQIALIAGVLMKLRRATSTDPRLMDRVEQLAQRLRMHPIPIRVISGIASPFIWSGWRPMLLWPRDLPSNLSPACLDGLVLHELAHVKRRDHWVGWLELFAGCVWWWNPLFWYVRSQLREQAELACDAWVVNVLPQGRRAYAEALLAVCDGFARGTAPLPVLGVGASSRLALERRLTMIMRGRAPFRLSRLGYISIALMTVAALPAVAQQSAAPPDPRVSLPVEVRPEPAVDQRLQQLGLQIAPEQARSVERRPARTPEELVALGLQRRGTIEYQKPAALPDEAKKLIDQFGVDEDKIRQDADAAIAAKRDQTIKQLQAMQDAQTKAGHLDEALTIRSSIRQLEQESRLVVLRGRIGERSDSLSTDSVRALTAARIADAPLHILTRGTFSANARLAPADLSGYRTRVGETISFVVEGSTSGSVWGDGVYSAASSLAAAAVHAGAVSNGRLGCVAVTMLPGQDSYRGSTSHDVTSREFGPNTSSYRVARAESCTVEVTGTTTGDVWGTDVYTDDSSIAAAAVHAGVLKAGERGSVKITILPGRDRYEASERNGVKSEAFAKYEGSFKVERAK